MPCGTYGNCGYSSGTVTRQDVHVNWLLPNTHFSFFCSVEESVSLYLSSSDNIHCFDEVSTPITRIDWQYSDGLVNLLALLQRSTESHNRNSTRTQKSGLERMDSAVSQFSRCVRVAKEAVSNSCVGFFQIQFDRHFPHNRSFTVRCSVRNFTVIPRCAHRFHEVGHSTEG